ncbi:Glycosyltransferase GtfA [Mycobacteroides abscessus subsp. abscessus]|nr:Glycosyltransferase GtfA [Mycobacteroides abscessus subsp. abscessus]
MDTKTWLDVYRNFWTFFFHTFWKVREIRTMWRQMWELSDECWAQMNTTLMSAAQGADVLFAGQSYQEPAANGPRVPRRSGSPSVARLRFRGMTRSVSRVWPRNGRSGMDCGHSWAR